jgi:hypothetical protein
MKSINRYLAILLWAPAIAIGLAWWAYFNSSTSIRHRGWNVVNLAAVILQTGCYVCLASPFLLLKPLFSDSMILSWLDRHSFAIAHVVLVIGPLGGALAFCGRGAARVQIGVAGLLLTLMALIMPGLD